MQFARVPLFLCLVAFAGSWGCSTDSYADGIGRPVQQPIDSPQVFAVAIVEVYPAASGAFVELLGGALATPLDLAAFQLDVVPAGAATSTFYPLTGTLDANGRIAVAPAGLTFVASAAEPPPVEPVNPTQSGELALVETATDVVHSYFAWGSDPSSRASPLYVRALQSGAATSSVSITVPFPRPIDTSIVREGEHVGCSAPTQGTSPSDVVCTTIATPITLREVAPMTSETSASWVELENTSTQPLDIGNLRVCHESECSLVPQSTVVAAGAVNVFCLGANTASCPAGGVALSGSTAIAGDSETFIAAPGGASRVSDSEVLDYFRTDLGSSAYQDLAISLGLWAADIAPTGTYVPGESLSRNPGTTAPPVWFPALVTPGATNPVIDRVSNWQSCAEPATVTTDFPLLVVTALSRADDGTVTLTNTDPTPDDEDSGTTLSLALGDFLVRIDDVEVLRDGVSLDGALDQSLSISLPVAIAEAGKFEIFVRETGALVQFGQWGNPASGVTAAVAANVWPSAACVLPRIGVDESLVLRDRTLIKGSGGYDVQ